MVDIGVHNEGFLEYPLKKLDDGVVIPDVSLSEVHRYNRDLLRNQIEVGVRADELGYDFVLHPENHLKLIGKNSPTPLQVQVAIAERTSDVRLLQMANILQWHDPVKLAERIGMLDVISDGRTEVGLGTGSGIREIETFGRAGEAGTDDEQRYERFDEKYGILLRSWVNDAISHHGEHYDVPPRDVEWDNEHENRYLSDEVSETSPEEFVDVDADPETLKSIAVFPRPVQQPHPQIWRPVGSTRAAVWAARHGANGCTFCTDFSWVGDLIEAYHDAAEAADWPDRRPEFDGEPFDYGWDQRRRRGIIAQVSIFNTEVASDEAFQRYKLGQEFLLSFRKSNAPFGGGDGVEIDAEQFIAENDAPIVGDADEIVDRLVTYRDVCSYEDFVVFPTIGAPGMTHEDKIEQLRAFAEDVVPYFEDDPA